MLFLMKKKKKKHLIYSSQIVYSFTVSQLIVQQNRGLCLHIYVCVYIVFRCFGSLILFSFYSSLSRVEVCSHLRSRQQENKL